MPAAKELNYLIVLTLREGRNFPFNAHEQIIAEAKFGTSTLTTDPKKYEVAPRFDEELCWSTTPRALHDHKLRRTPIKITVYGWDARTASRHQIGYITLDIRTYLTRDRFEWHSLVGVPYMREKPELHLVIKCEEDDKYMVDATSTANNHPSASGFVPPPVLATKSKAAAHHSVPAFVSLPRSNKNKQQLPVNKALFSTSTEPEPTEIHREPSMLLRPVLHENDAYFQLGQPKRSNEHFVFGLVLCYTKYLHTVATAPLDTGDISDHAGSVAEQSQSRGGENQSNMPYTFNFMLFGNAVANPFAKLDDKAVSADRASLRVHTDLSTLLAYFEQENIYKITIQRGNVPLVYAEFDVASTLVKAVRENGLPAIVYAEAPLRPVKGGATLSAASIPLLAVSFQLARYSGPDSLPKSIAGSTAPPSVVSNGSKSSLTSMKENHRTTSLNGRSPAVENPSVRNAEKLRIPADAATIRHNNNNRTEPASTNNTNQQQADQSPSAIRKRVVDPASDFETAPDEDKLRNKAESRTAERYDQARYLSGQDAGLADDAKPVPPGFDISSSPANDVIVASQSHHFCCTISLFSIRLTSPNIRKSMFVYARYTYAFFGTSAPIITRPSVEVPPRGERRLNNGYCSFSFACTSVQLRRAFECMPLTVEIYSTSSASRDRCIGVTKVPLGILLQQPRNQTTNNQSHNGQEAEQMFRQQHDGIVDIVDVENEETQQPLGQLNFKLCLDDYGPIQSQIFAVTPDDTNNASVLDQTLKLEDADHNNNNNAPVYADINSNHNSLPEEKLNRQFTTSSVNSVQMPNFFMPPPAITNGFLPTTPLQMQPSALQSSIKPDQKSNFMPPNYARATDQQIFMAGGMPQYHNSNNIPSTNVYSQASVSGGGGGGDVYAAYQSMQQHIYAGTPVNPQQQQQQQHAGDGGSRPLQQPTPSFTTHDATPPTRNEAGRINPGGAGSNVTDHENLLVNELMKLRLQKMEMQAAMELELWKEGEEKKFNEYLKQKEQESLKILANEWRRRDKEREQLFDERRRSYEEQEIELKNALDLVSTRERQLNDIGKELAFREEKLANERAALDMHLRDTEQRITKSYEEKFQNEKIITENLRHLLKENEDRLGKLEKRLGDKEQESADLRERLAERPEHQLRSQMEVLKVEKRELESRVREAMEQANHYKSQWSKAMADVHRIRDEERQTYGERIKLLTREVEHLKHDNKETRAIVSKSVAVKSNGREAAAVPSDDNDDDGGRETAASSADELQKSRRNYRQKNNNNFSTAATDAAVSSAYEESDAESTYTQALDARVQGPAVNNVAFGRSTHAQQARHKQPAQQQQPRRKTNKYDMDEEDDETRARKHELLKLMDERNVLLKTGIYSPDDEMIRDLNKKIRELEVQLIDDGVSIPDT